MKSNTTKILTTIVSGALLSTAAGTALAQSTAVQPAQDDIAVNESVTEHVQTTQSAVVTASVVEGTFSYGQAEITPNNAIAHIFGDAAKNLCNSTYDPIVMNNPLEWQLSVTGDVECEYVVSIAELASEDSVMQAMSCTCAGNPIDGLISAFAETKGIPVSHLVERAGAHGDANTITFVSADGTETAMPLAYVVGRHAVISYEINGEDLSASMGGNNQLWMQGTPANYFVRDIVEVRITAEEEVPANPGENMDLNTPNIAVTASVTA